MLYYARDIGLFLRHAAAAIPPGSSDRDDDFLDAGILRTDSFIYHRRSLRQSFSSITLRVAGHFKIPTFGAVDASLLCRCRIGREPPRPAFGISAYFASASRVMKPRLKPASSPTRNLTNAFMKMPGIDFREYVTYDAAYWCYAMRLESASGFILKWHFS